MQADASMGAAHIFKVVQMVPNHAKCLICLEYSWYSIKTNLRLSSLNSLTNIKIINAYNKQKNIKENQQINFCGKPFASSNKIKTCQKAKKKQYCRYSLPRGSNFVILETTILITVKRSPLFQTFCRR